MWKGESGRGRKEPNRSVERACVPNVYARTWDQGRGHLASIHGDRVHSSAGRRMLRGARAIRGRDDIEPYVFGHGCRLAIPRA